MPEHSKNSKQQTSQTTLVEYITVAVADDLELAQEYAEDLGKNDIPFVISSRKEHSPYKQPIAIIVPADHHDHARQIIESRRAFDHFLDGEFNQEQDDDSSNEFDDDIGWENNPDND